MPSTKDQTRRPSSFLPLMVLLVFVVVLGGALHLATAGDPGSHFMTGPGIAIMVSFMPLTAITYLQYRLPQKQEEFEAIRRALDAPADDPEVFGFLLRQEESAADYFLPIFFVSFFSIMGFYILFANSADVLFDGANWAATYQERYPEETYRRNVVSIGMAFLGAYIWAIQYIFRRMMTLDLPPGAYFSVGTRMIYSSFLAVIFQYFLSSADVSDGAFLSSQFVVVSFLIGIFPDRALSWMRGAIGGVFAKPKVAAIELPLEMIEGISGFHKARLFELGIDDIQNLAHASLLELILKTPFKPRVLVDWMAQARLCLEFKDKTNLIRAAGVRTILDFQEVCEANDETLIAKLAGDASVDIELIRTVYVANSKEVSISRLRKAYDVLNTV